MKPKKSLQKFTESEKKINDLLLLKQITLQDIKSLTEAERSLLEVAINEKINTSKGVEKEQFLNKIEPITTDESKNVQWEINHNQITWAISTLMQEYGRMPTKTELAIKTELSRQTIHKHLKEYHLHPEYVLQIDQLKFLASRVLAKVFHFAVTGDMKAAKLYLNFFGQNNIEQKQNNTLIQNQNNYIQINEYRISQDEIQNLSQHQIKTIIKTLKLIKPNHLPE
jgi:hypothetical protein